jgi:uncharacterized protein
MERHGVALPEDRIGEIARRYGVRRVRLFGSLLSDQFGASSDVDLLVEFGPETRIGYFRFCDLADELTRVVGRTVDLQTPASLSRYFREKVLAEAVTVWDDGS